MIYKKVSLSHLPLSFLQQNLLAILSGLLLSVAFLDHNYYMTAWVAFVPFLMAIKGVNLVKSYWLGFLSGLAFSISAGYWVVDFIMLSKGYTHFMSSMWAFVFWLYCAQLSALIALFFNALKTFSKIHEFILFPLIIVAVYSSVPMLFTVRLGESQSQFLSAIQATEFTGVHGLDAIIGLSNIVIFKLITELSGSLRIHKISAWLFAAFIISSWFIYGSLSLQTWDQKITHWESIRLGIIQPNEVPSLEHTKILPGFSRAFPPEMAMTERLSTAGAEIVIWPEAKYKAYFDQPHVKKAYQHQVSLLNTSLIFQDIQRTKSADITLESQQYNTAVMLSNNGEEFGNYQKMKRIAFGEYVPFVSDIPVIKSWIESFFGKFLNEITKGDALSYFAHQKINIIPLICYELMFPDFVASAVANAQMNSQSSGLLVGLSSNGWFGDTRQPYQHVNASILRAVENRMPLVHVVNNGPSIVALPTGHVIFTSPPHVAGGYIVDTPYSAGGSRSFYSQYPNMFIYSVYGSLILIIFLSLMVRSSKKNTI